MPSRLFVQNVVLLEDLLHEIRLAQVGHDSGVSPIDPELVAPMRQVVEAYSVIRHAMCEQAQQALAAGRERVDLELRFPPEVAAAARDLAAVAEQADTMARQLHLLTVPAPPEVVALRRWVSGQIEGQLDRGAPPEPFESRDPRA